MPAMSQTLPFVRLQNGRNTLDAARKIFMLTDKPRMVRLCLRFAVVQPAGTAANAKEDCGDCTAQC